MASMPPASERTYDDSLRVDFYIELDPSTYSAGHGCLARTDGVNWNLVGLDYHPSINGSGSSYGPDQLVSAEQSAAYAAHVVFLWNRYVDELHAPEPTDG